MNIATTAAVWKITRTLFAGQSLCQAAVVAVTPIMAIAGSKLSGHPAWAGVPAMCSPVGQALAAFGWGYAMDPLGRRGMLTYGYGARRGGGDPLWLCDRLEHILDFPRGFHHDRNGHLSSAVVAFCGQ